MGLLDSIFVYDLLSVAARLHRMLICHGDSLFLCVVWLDNGLVVKLSAQMRSGVVRAGGPRYGSRAPPNVTASVFIDRLMHRVASLNCSGQSLLLTSRYRGIARPQPSVGYCALGPAVSFQRLGNPSGCSAAQPSRSPVVRSAARLRPVPHALNRLGSAHLAVCFSTSSLRRSLCYSNWILLSRALDMRLQIGNHSRQRIYLGEVGVASHGTNVLYLFQQEKGGDVAYSDHVACPSLNSARSPHSFTSTRRLGVLLRSYRSKN